MADLGKLWFELGMKDNVSKELDKIKNDMKSLEESANSVSAALKEATEANAKASKASSSNAGKNLTNLDKAKAAINKITKQMEKLDNLRKNNNFNVNVSGLDAAYESLAKAKAGYELLVNAGKVSTKELQVQNSNLALAQSQVALETQRFTQEVKRKSAAEKEGVQSTKEQNNALREQEMALMQSQKAISNYAKSFDSLNEKSKTTNRYVSEMKNQLLSLVSLYAAEGFVKNMITIGGEFEKQHIALKSMLGDAQQANEIFSQIKALAPISPFTFRDLSSYVKQLTAFNVPYVELYDTTKRLADISAGLGVDMSRLILAYGQVRSASVLRGQELRQFTEAGIPMVQALAEKLTEVNGKLVTTGEVFDYISKRKVPFEMVKEVLWDMTDAGGRFNDMQLTLSETLAGKWSNLQDAWEIMLSTMANSETIMGETLKGGVQMLTNMVNVLNKLTPMLAVGGIFATFPAIWHKTTNAFSAQTKAMSETIMKNKALQASQIQMNVAAEKQTWIQKEILRTKDKISAIDIAILASEKKISALQAKILIDTNDITYAEMRRLSAEGVITKELNAQIFAATRLNTVLGKIGNFLKANGAMLALSAFGAALGYFWNEIEIASNMSEEAADNAAKRFEDLNKTLEHTFKEAPKDASKLKTEISSIENALDGIDPFFDKFKEAHDKDSMSEYYNALRGELDKTTAAYKLAARVAANYASAVRGKGSFEFWEDSTDTDIKDWNSKRGDIQSYLAGIGMAAQSSIRESIQKVAEADEEAAKAIAGETSLFGMLNKLIGDETDEDTASKNLSALVHFSDETIGGYIQSLNVKFNRWSILEGRQAKSLRQQRAEMIKQFKQTAIDAKNAVYESGEVTQDDVDNVTDNFKYYFGTMLTTWAAQWENFGDDAKIVMNKVLKEMFGIDDLFKVGLSGSGVGGSGGSTGGSGSGSKDTLLEKWKEEFDELKKFYSQYKKWAKDIGKDAALDRLKKSGIFSTMFDNAGKPIYNMDDFKDALEKFREKLEGGTSARNKFMLSVDLEIDNVDYDKSHEALEDAAKRLSESLSDEVAKYNLFEKIFEKTGDKEFAMSAFMKGRVWDDISRGMAQRLSEMLGKSVSEIDFDADSITMEKQLEGTKGAYEYWKKIVEITEGNYTKMLENAATATEKMMNYDEKIVKAQVELEELRKKGASNAEQLLKEKEITDLQTQQFENSKDYLLFYSSILSMTTDEAERVGAAIRENLVKQLANGNINADKYLKSMKNVTSQIEKARGGLLGNSDFATFINGGQKGLVDKRWDEMASAAIEVQKAEEKLIKAREKGNESEILTASYELNIAKQRLEEMRKALKISEDQYKQLSDISMIADVVMGALDGMKSAAQSISTMFDAIGNEDAANKWSDIADGIGIVTDTLKPLDGILKNFMSGNISGMVSNAILAPVNLITAPITGIAKLHDKKLDRAIQTSVEEVNKLKTAYEDLEENISNRLGGIYGGNEYKNMLANLQKQRSELQKQMQLEDEKKKTDKQKMEDYKNSISDMDNQIKEFAADMAESLYSINVKSWAKELTDAVVDAWAKGEDAADAFHDKVRDIMQDLTTNILTQKVMEAALQPVFDEIVNEMDKKSGKLDEESIDRFASALDARVEEAVPAITGILDRLKANGWDFSDKDSSSSSGLSKGIQGTSEETSNLLASYLNAVRADVSVIRSLIDSVYGSSETSIATSQLRQLEMITQNTERNAAAAERIESVLNSVTLGTKKIYIN